VFVSLKHIQEKKCRYWDLNQHNYSPKSIAITC